MKRAQIGDFDHQVDDNADAQLEELMKHFQKTTDNKNPDDKKRMNNEEILFNALLAEQYAKYGQKMNYQELLKKVNQIWQEKSQFLQFQTKFLNQYPDKTASDAEKAWEDLRVLRQIGKLPQPKEKPVAKQLLVPDVNQQVSDEKPIQKKNLPDFEHGFLVGKLDPLTGLRPVELITMEDGMHHIKRCKLTVYELHELVDRLWENQKKQVRAQSCQVLGNPKNIWDMHNIAQN